MLHKKGAFMRNLIVLVAVLLITGSVVAQTPQSYSRGDTVRIASQGQMKPSPNPRVVAIAGDRVRVDHSGVLVNEMPVTWVSRDFAAIYGSRPVDRVVPEGHYVVIADYRQNEDISQFFGFVSAGSIIGRAENGGVDVTRGLAFQR